MTLGVDLFIGFDLSTEIQVRPFALQKPESILLSKCSIAPDEAIFC